LVVVTIFALVTSGKTKHSAAIEPRAKVTVSTPPTATGSRSLKSDDPGRSALNSVLPSDALPDGPAYTLQGKGTFSVVPGSGPVVGSGTVHRYTIEVEDGITGIDVTAFAKKVQAVLSDPKSWTAEPGVALQRVDSGQVDFHVTLTSSMTVRTVCGYDIPIETSCYAPANSANGLTVNRVVINDSRWVRGDAAYVGDLGAYQEYMINHEDGHALGHQHAHDCLSDGLAPAMMQQTLGLKGASGKMCQANPWPFPTGASDAPGAEAADTVNNNEFNLNQ